MEEEKMVFDRVVDRWARMSKEKRELIRRILNFVGLILIIINCILVYQQLTVCRECTLKQIDFVNGGYINKSGNLKSLADYNSKNQETVSGITIEHVVVQE